jgi:biopolymer transport protein TolQ
MNEASSYSILDLIKQADVVVQTVMFVLAAASIWSWTIAFDKIFKSFILKIKTNRFEETFGFARTIEDVIKLSKRRSSHPFAKILSVAVKEWQLNDIRAIITSNDHHKKNSIKERMRDLTQITIDNSVIKLSKGMNFLAITGSVAPFIGLFGTVWGIMNSFQGIAISKNTSLSVVAPGIAEALLATAIGLFAAIPAVFFYNVYNNKLNNFVDRMNGFAITVTNTLSRILDQEITKK